MSVCNIYKPMNDAPVFYTFSEYMNDLVVNINNDGMSIAKPSRFICLNLDNIDGINEFLYRYYDDACCRLRDENAEVVDENDNSINYRSVLLGCLIKGLQDNGYLTDVNNVACGDIDLFGDGTIDGMKYDEIVCYLSPSDANNNSIIKKDDVSIEIKKTGGFIQGYSRPGDRIIEGVNYESMVTTGSDNDYFKCYEYEINKSNTTDNKFEFNAILVLYDIYLGKDEKSAYTNIPLGMYINPNKIEKYINSNEIYNQGTSYAVRIAMRFATTYDGNIYVEDANTYDETRDISSLVAVADRLSASIDAIKAMTASFNEYRNITQDLITAIHNSSSSTNWRGYGDGRTYNNYPYSKDE